MTLEEKVRSGDETVKYEQIEKARGLKRFAELRREAAQAKAEALAEKLERDKINGLLAEHLPGAQSVDAEIEGLLVQARQFVDQALAVARKHDRHVFAIALAATSAGNEYHPESNPEIIGESRLPEFTWFETRGQRAETLSPGTVLTRLLSPYRDTMSASRRYTEIREATRA
ncbi:hypothetical protein [Frondihabitans cladoniiphilus]|uniref:hypothetical protein n=1 Tax=Frondihabitans cladoniiphilus TaxID=715785 RepID=UPI0031EC9563